MEHQCRGPQSLIALPAHSMWALAGSRFWGLPSERCLAAAVANFEYIRRVTNVSCDPSALPWIRALDQRELLPCRRDCQGPGGIGATRCQQFKSCVTLRGPPIGERADSWRGPRACADPFPAALLVAKLV